MKRFRETNNNNDPESPIGPSMGTEISGKNELEQIWHLDVAENLYLDLANSVPAGIYRIWVSGDRSEHESNWQEETRAPYEFEFINDVFCEMLCRSRAEIVKTPGLIIEMIFEADRDGFASINREANLKVQPFEWEGRMVIEGSTVWVRFKSLPQPLLNGDILWTGVLSDITARKQYEVALIKDKDSAEDLVRQRTKELETQKRLLEQKNIALRELIAQVNQEKQHFEDKLAVNLEKLILPQMDMLRARLPRESISALETLDQNLKEFQSSFGKKISNAQLALTPKEIEICNYVKSGKTSKEIGQILKISDGTVTTHRNSIRRKLNINNSQVNLVTYLNTL